LLLLLEAVNLGAMSLTDVIAGGFEEEVGRSVEYLSSDGALDSIRADPYWPKWDSPWWHMTLLWEMGLAERIPRTVVDTMRQTVDGHFLHFFPVRFDLLPPEIDTRREAMCHCGLGTIYQVLTACGIDVDAEIPWMRPWLSRYQLPDGGLNCDEEVYTKTTPKSSIVSTLPPLEAVLFCTGREFTLEELEFLDRGAEYLLDHRLYRSLSSGEVIFPGWLELCFPRFYFYDVLRGIRFLARWAVIRGRSLPQPMLDEVTGEIQRSMTGNGLVPGRRPWAASTTLSYEDGKWVERQPVVPFPLLEAVGRSEMASPFLTRVWEQTQADLDRL
jgi:hypothetical protein